MLCHHSHPGCLCPVHPDGVFPSRPPMLLVVALQRRHLGVVESNCHECCCCCGLFHCCRLRPTMLLRPPLLPSRCHSTASIMQWIAAAVVVVELCRSIANVVATTGRWNLIVAQQRVPLPSWHCMRLDTGAKFCENYLRLNLIKNDEKKII